MGFVVMLSCCVMLGLQDFICRWYSFERTSKAGGPTTDINCLIPMKSWKSNHENIPEELSWEQLARRYWTDRIRMVVFAEEYLGLPVTGFVWPFWFRLQAKIAIENPVSVILHDLPHWINALEARSVKPASEWRYGYKMELKSEVWQ